MNNIARKIRGLWIIIYALMPIILIAIFIVILLAIVNDVRDLVSGPINQIDANLTQLQSNVGEAGKIIETSLEPIKKFNQDIQNAFAAVEQVPIIGNIKVIDFSDAFNSIPQIQQLFEYSQSILFQLEQSVKEVQNIAMEILTLIALGGTIIILLFLQLFIVPYIRWMRNRIKAGWDLIKG
ncbi:MAG: hypothetical protein KI793_00080 [Rivularia sp. (in: Bacteria)]|nr:hypothetical protein [Rivularia sp. MS3]